MSKSGATRYPIATRAGKSKHKMIPNKAYKCGEGECSHISYAAAKMCRSRKRKCSEKKGFTGKKSDNQVATIGFI